jgi:hypothetical protein
LLYIYINLKKETITFDLVSTFPCPIPGLEEVKYRFSHTRYIWEYIIEVDCQSKPENEQTYEPCVNIILPRKYELQTAIDNGRN